ncbi:MAG: TonB-dependent receptor domain-containing protein, partial [Gammaproteobacteria bacterium]
MNRLTAFVSSAAVTLVTGSALLVTPATGYTQALEEITVTARKTAESLQEVPLAITAIGEEDIKRLGINDLTKITQQDTSVQFDEGFTPSDTRITIRGLSPTRGRPNAATLVDGIDLTSEAVSNAGGSTLINPRLIDVERIEIVKGPQSALYGRSAFAGALQYITKDPADVLSGEISVDANTEDAQDVRGNVSIPINDTLGVLLNGSWWDSRGSYKNSATNDYVGGGDGLGGSVTVKWEPTDTLSFKWRTEYSDDNFDPAPQVLLNNRNSLVDLGNSGGLPGNVSNIAPLSGNCTGNGFDYSVDPPGGAEGPVGTAGPLDNYNCGNGFLFDNWFSTAFDGSVPVDNNGNPKNIGTLYDPADPWLRNVYNKQVVSLYQGQIPDGDDLRVALSPNYRNGTGATDKFNANDYDGVDKEVFRTSLVTEWAITDTLDFTSYTSYLDSTVEEELDLGKYYVDECSQDVTGLFNTPDPLGNTTSYGQAILDANPDLTNSYNDLAAFADCNPLLGPDGINDAPIGFAQDSTTDTTQFSQELRGSWQVNESVNFTTGLLYWKEEVEQKSRNSTTVGIGPECYAPAFFNAAGQFDTAVDGNVNNGGTPLGSVKDQCGLTSTTIAFWMDETYQGRLAQPDTAKRNTDHYSWYGSLDFDLTEKLSARLEARFTREENEVTGLVQNPCLDPTQTVGDAGCPEGPGGGGAAAFSGAGGRAQGPSAVVLCGLSGRCDRLGVFPAIGGNYTPGAPSDIAGNLYATPQAQGTYSAWEWGYQPMPGNSETLNKTDRFWAPRATIEYFWNDDIMTYFSWSRGIKPGGFSLLTSGAFGLDANLDGNFDDVDFDEERLDVWEIGAKTTLFNGRVRLNGAMYYQDFKDK